MENEKQIVYKKENFQKEKRTNRAAQRINNFLLFSLETIK